MENLQLPHNQKLNKKLKVRQYNGTQASLLLKSQRIHEILIVNPEKVES